MEPSLSVERDERSGVYGGERGGVAGFVYKCRHHHEPPPPAGFSPGASRRKMTAPDTRIRLQKPGYALRKQDVGSDKNPEARVAKMTVREERRRLRKKDERPGSRIAVREEAGRLGKPKNRPSKQIGGSGRKKPGIQGRSAPRTPKNGFGKQSGRPDGENGRGSGEDEPGSLGMA